MNDWLTTTVRKWMKRTDEVPPDARESARAVMARVPQVRQRADLRPQRDAQWCQQAG